MIKKITLFLGLLMSTSGLTQANNIELSNCLQECWGIDRHSASYICNKLAPLSKEPEGASILDEFITQSRELKIDFSTNKEPQSLPSEDAIIKAPKHHKVIFESPYVRVLLVSVEAGEREPFHLHAWRRFCIVTKPTTYEEELADGQRSIDESPIGFFGFPGGNYGAYTNIGQQADESILFEIKD